MHLTPDRDALRESLAEHFVMWHDLDEHGGPRGEWRCACGAKFGFSDSAIDHQAANLPVVSAATLADDEALNDRLWDVLDEHGHNGIDCRPEKPMDYTVTTMLNALAATLTERAAR